MAMKSYICLTLCLAIVSRVDTRQRSDDLDGTQDLDQSKDFDFEDKKSSSKSSLNSELRQMYNWWTIEDICKDVKCKSWEYCVIKSKGIAICVPKKTSDVKEEQLLKDRLKDKPKSKPIDTDDDDEDEDDYDEEEDIEEKSVFAKTDENKLKLCNPCPVVRPEFICGSDNATYSSICRLDFHNCVHKTDVRLQCTGFCPCIKKKVKKEKKSTKSHKSDKYLDNKEKKLNKLKAEKNWYYLDKSNDKIGKKSKFYPKSNKLKEKIESRDKSQNSVLNHKQYESNTEKIPSKKCSAEDLKSMGSRLLDWFSVVIAEQKKEHHFQNKKQVFADCEPQVWYMFNRFDTNNDLKLSVKELYYLEHDQNEHCLQPYLDQCDEDNDRFLSAYEWCTCFDKKSQPCFNALKHMKKGLLGAYSPQCDSQGFYKPMQCHSGSGICWCVDKNGVEFTNTRRRGSPDCKGLLSRARHRNIEDQILSREDVDVDDDGDDDDDTDGSGDGRISD